MPLNQPSSSFINEFDHFFASVINMPSMAAALSYIHKVLSSIPLFKMTMKSAIYNAKRSKVQKNLYNETIYTYN